jgi:hypothetical protein
MAEWSRVSTALSYGVSGRSLALAIDVTDSELATSKGPMSPRIDRSGRRGLSPALAAPAPCRHELQQGRVEALDL